jgi:uncharacterized membrane-anchored protein
MTEKNTDETANDITVDVTSKSEVLEQSAEGLKSNTGLQFHPRYFDLLAETHARTATGIGSPCLITHLVFMSTENDSSADRQLIEKMLESPFIAPIEIEANSARMQTSRGELRWARHTEFSTFTLHEESASASTSGKGMGDFFQSDWGVTPPGQLLLALQVHVEDSSETIWWRDWENRPSKEPSGALSRVNGGAAIIRYNFMPQKDGFLHLYVKDSSGNERVRGRVAQRLIDIETYRTLALLAMPEVKRIGPIMAGFDRDIAAIARDLSADKKSDDEALLARITAIAADVEELSVSAQFRLNASTAYAEIVSNRLDDLREEKVEGYQRFSSFIRRRLLPAVRTYESILDRQSQISARISRISDLLRASVDVELERQNQNLLASMDQRVNQQLKLQRTVEGLSVIAISYYLIGILLYFFKPLKEMTDLPGLGIVTIAIVPLVLAGVWIVIKKIRRDTDV